jgi:hypothetical protein
LVCALRAVKLTYPLVYDQQSLTFIYIAQLRLFVIHFNLYSWTIARPLERSLSISIPGTRVFILLLSGIPSAIDHATLIATHLLPSLARYTACIYNSRHHERITSSTSASCREVHHLHQSRSYNRPSPIRHLQYHFDHIICV